MGGTAFASGSYLQNCLILSTRHFPSLLFVGNVYVNPYTALLKYEHGGFIIKSVYFNFVVCLFCITGGLTGVFGLASL